MKKSNNAIIIDDPTKLACNKPINNKWFEDTLASRLKKKGSRIKIISNPRVVL